MSIRKLLCSKMKLIPSFVECRDSTYGPDCSEVCHCNADNCNIFTGCDGECHANWDGLDCRTGMNKNDSKLY